MEIYFPVLRWKQGERAALANLGLVKERIAPIIEFPLGCDSNDNKFAKFCNTAVADWGIGKSLYLDLSTVDYDVSQDEINHPALVTLRTAYRRQLSIIPVISVDINPELFDVIRQARQEGCFNNIALRISEEEDKDSEENASLMLRELNIGEANVDLIIDMRDVSNGSIGGKTRIVNDLINQFGSSYRKIILISGSFPNNLSDYIGTNQNGYIPRYDWQLWNRVRNLPNCAGLLFGDYTTIPCEFREIPYRGAPKIKYTLDSNWFIIKGHRPRQRDNQRQTQALDIINAPFYRGSEYSFGENRIRQCADGTWGPGNPTNWVTIDISQHITFVTSQVSAILAAP